MELKKFSKNEAGTDYIVGDIHGCYTLLMNQLKEIRFDKANDRLFSVGDLVDRGPESYNCLSLPYEPWFYAVRGNHEILMHDALHGINQGLWFVNGGAWCASHDLNDLRILVDDVMGRLPLAIELETETGTVGIIHADCTSGVWGDFDAQRDVWDRSRLERETRDYKPVAGVDRLIVGHTITPKIKGRDNVIYIDTGAFYTQKLTIIRADERFD